MLDIGTAELLVAVRATVCSSCVLSNPAAVLKKVSGVFWQHRSIVPEPWIFLRWSLILSVRPEAYLQLATGQLALGPWIVILCRAKSYDRVKVVVH